MKFVFIINTSAGKGKYDGIINRIEKVCREEEKDFEIRYVTSDITSYDIAMEYKDLEVVIYVVGGDGTIAVTLPALVGTKNKLGIIPTGSGNDTYRVFKKLDYGFSSIDLGRINGRYFINVACTGIDAEVANNVNIIKKTCIPVKYRYYASILYTFVHFRFKKVTMSTSVKTICDKYSILSVCNGMYYGGGFKIAPKSRLSDGLFDVYYAEKMSRFKMIPLMLKLKNGKHEGKRRVHKFRTNHVDIKLDEPVVFNVDGEMMEDTKFVIDMVHNGLEVYNNNDLVDKIMGN